jgi:JAB1/Mov34/MPN/PAD-1 ubiquitin protease
MAGAAHKLKGSDSEYQDHSRTVACPRSVILALRAAVLESFASGSHGGAEVYGILFGTHSGDQVRISDFQAITFQSAMAGASPLSEEERHAFAAALEAVAGRSDLKGREPVGWFRAHPHSELTLTARDLEIAGTFFPGAHQVVMILRPSESALNLVRFFYRESDGMLTVDSPFSEFNMPAAFDTSPLAEVPAEREAPSVPSPSRSPAPTPAPAAVRRPEAAAPEAGLVLFPEPPVFPRRRIHLVWPLLLATVLATLGGWYWLTRPPERLGLRVFDAGGQLRILWDAVPNGEAGNLEIIDGGARYSIALDADQLRRGTFTYSRHSGNVQVRLEASRRGAESLVEAASFAGKNATPTELYPAPTGSASREGSRTSGVRKPVELVLSVPVTVPRAARPKFSAPAASAPGPVNRAPDLAPPPQIAQSAPASVPAAVERLSLPPVEKAAPPARQPEAAGIPTQAAPAKPLVTPAPQRAASVPVSPASGRIIWIGRLQKNEELEINGKSCSTGTLIGELPGKPVKFSVSPGNLSNDGIVLYTANPDYANNVIESPGARNGWNKTTYTWNPKYANDVTVQETPAAQNQWNRVALHSKNPKISVIVIDWSLVN